MKRKCLFLVAVVLLAAMLCACGHSHEFGPWEVSKNPTCSEEGSTERSCECGEKETAPIPVLKHTYSEERIVTEPTCVADGEKMVICSECGDSYVEAITSVGEHKYSGKVTAEATCIEDGVKTFTCSACGDSYTETIKASGKHAYSSKVTTAATCTEDGEKTFTCSGCGDSYTEKLAASGHKYSGKTTEAATCTKEGKRTFTCSGCGDSYTEVIKKTSHTWKSATCTTAKTCSGCGATEGTALGHKVSNGKCSRCGVKISAVLYEDSKVKITFHSVEKDKYSADEAEVYLYLENKTAKTLLIQADAFSLNGYSFCNLVMSDEVNAYSTGKINVSINEFDFDLVDIGNIVTVGAQFRVMDDANWSDKYVVVFSNVKIDGTGVGTKPQDFSNRNLLYSDKKISIYYKSIAKDKYSADEAELYLFVENKTAKTLLIQADAVALNKYSYSYLIMSDNVLPGTIGIVNVSINEFDFDLVDINNITSVGGQFRIMDDANWSDRYVASFTNVKVQ